MEKERTFREAFASNEDGKLNMIVPTGKDGKGGRGTNFHSDAILCNDIR